MVPAALESPRDPDIEETASMTGTTVPAPDGPRSSTIPTPQQTAGARPAVSGWDGGYGHEHITFRPRSIDAGRPQWSTLRYPAEETPMGTIMRAAYYTVAAASAVPTAAAAGVLAVGTKPTGRQADDEADRGTGRCAVGVLTLAFVVSRDCASHDLAVGCRSTAARSAFRAVSIAVLVDQDDGSKKESMALLGGVGFNPRVIMDDAMTSLLAGVWPVAALLYLLPIRPACAHPDAKRQPASGNDVLSRGRG